MLNNFWTKIPQNGYINTYYDKIRKEIKSRKRLHTYVSNTKCSPPPPALSRFLDLPTPLNFIGVEIHTYNFLKIGRPPHLSESKFKQEPNLFLAPLTLHFRCKEFRKSTFSCLPKLMLNYLYRQNVWNFSDTIIGHFLTRNSRGQIFKTLTLEFWYLLSLCVIFRQNGNRWPIVELFPVKNSNVESENCLDSMSRLAIVKQPCQTEPGFLGHMCIY